VLLLSAGSAVVLNGHGNCFVPTGDGEERVFWRRGRSIGCNIMERSQEIWQRCMADNVLIRPCARALKVFQLGIEQVGKFESLTETDGK